MTAKEFVKEKGLTKDEKEALYMFDDGLGFKGMIASKLKKPESEVQIIIERFKRLGFITDEQLSGGIFLFPEDKKIKDTLQKDESFYQTTKKGKKALHECFKSQI